MTLRSHFLVAVALGGLLISVPSFSQIITTDSTAAETAANQVVADTAITGIQDVQPASAQAVVDSASSGIQKTQPATEVQQTTTKPASVEQPAQVAEAPAASPKVEESVCKKKTHLMGIGVDLGFQFFGPAQINDYLDTVYSRMKAVYRSNGYMITGERGTPTMFLGFDVGGHIMVRPIPWIAVGGIGRYFSSTKKLKISTSSASLLDAMSDPDVTVSARDGVVGGKIEAFVNPKKTVTLKGGINIEAHFASVELKNENTVTLSGKGIGYTPFLGLSIAPGGGHALISLDFMAPICKIKLNTVKGAFDPTEDRYAFPSSSSTAKPIQYPRELNLTGFMFKPSVTICFP